MQDCLVYYSVKTPSSMGFFILHNIKQSNHYAIVIVVPPQQLVSNNQHNPSNRISLIKKRLAMEGSHNAAIEEA